MKISHSHLLKIINEELELEALDWSNVGSDARRWMGGMHLAKYPGPWGSGHEPLVTEDDEPEWVEDDEKDSPDGSDSESIRHPERKRTGRRRGSKDASFSFQHGEHAEAELLRNVQILRDVRTAFRGSDSESCSFDFSRILMDIYAAYDAFVEVYGEKLPSPESGEEFLMYGKVDINILNKIDDALDYIEENPLECGYKRRWFEESRGSRSEERQWATFMYLGINAMMPRRRGRGIMNLQRELGCVSWEYLCTLSEEEQDRITALHPICPPDRISGTEWRDCPGDIQEQRDFESKKLRLRSLIKNEMYMIREKEIKKLRLIESSSDYIQIYNRHDMASTINALIKKIKNIEDAIEMMGGSVIDIKTEPEDIEVIDLDKDLASVDKGE